MGSTLFLSFGYNPRFLIYVYIYQYMPKYTHLHWVHFLSGIQEWIVHIYIFHVIEFFFTP